MAHLQVGEEGRKPHQKGKQKTWRPLLNAVNAGPDIHGEDLDRVACRDDPGVLFKNIPAQWNPTRFKTSAGKSRSGKVGDQNSERIGSG